MTIYASNERSRQRSGVAPAAGSSSCIFAWSGMTSGTFFRSSRGAFVRDSTTADWRGGAARNRETFAGCRVGYSKKGDRYAHNQDTSAQRRYVAYCRGADGCSNPLHRSTLQQQQQQQQQLRMLHELRQLGIYTNTEAPGAAYQLDTGAFAAEVTYTMVSSQPSCSGGRNRIVSQTPSRRPWTSPRRRVRKQHNRARRFRFWGSTMSSNG